MCFKFAIEKFKFVNRLMDIVSRLKSFLSQNGISNSTFADTCLIPRPTLSQLLNGRNKKVSDELISKIHAAYPSLNILWLMFGDGDMFVPNANSSAISNSAQPAENSKFSETPSTGFENQVPVQKAISFGEDAPTYSPKSAPQMQVNALSAALQNLARNAAKLPSSSSKSASNDRRVSQILVFYSDSSYDMFFPSR